jgi:hypothetical protein
MSLRQEEKWTENCDNASVAASNSLLMFSVFMSDSYIVMTLRWKDDHESWPGNVVAYFSFVYLRISRAGLGHHSYAAVLIGGRGVAVSMASIRYDHHWKNGLTEFGRLKSDQESGFAPPPPKQGRTG